MRSRRSRPMGRTETAPAGGRLLFLLVGVLLAGSGPEAAAALQVERVHSYRVDIRVQQDGWLDVTEEIRFRVGPRGTEGRLRRDLPVGPPRPGGFGWLTAPLEFVRRDVSTRLEVHSSGGSPGTSGLRVWLGIPGRSVPPGDRFYGFSYRTTRWLVFDGDRSRLTWDVTPDPWSVPVGSVTARVHLPGTVGEEAVALRGWIRSGGMRDGSLSTSLEVDPRWGSVATLRSRRPVRSDEGVTIEVDFPARLTSRPAPEQEAAWARLDRRPYTGLAGVVLLVTGFFLVVWMVAGRDPPAPAVVVEYEPPDGLSPAGMGYLDKRGYGPGLLTATIMSLARKGVLEIEETGRTWTVRRVGPFPLTLTPDERAVAETLLPREDALVITGTSHRRFREARRALRKELGRRFRGRYFVGNRGWSAVGFLLSLAGLALLVSRIRFGLASSSWIPVAGLLVWGIPTGLFLTRGLRRWRIDLAERAPKPTLFAAGVFPLLATILLAFLGVLAHEAYEAVPPHLFLAALVLSGVNAAFFQLLERPTVAGRTILNQVEGYRRFLAATEEDRFRHLSTSESRKLCERALPYAVALGMENSWATTFGGAMTPIIQDDGA